MKKWISPCIIIFITLGVIFLSIENVYGFIGNVCISIIWVALLVVVSKRNIRIRNGNCYGGTKLLKAIKRDYHMREIQSLKPRQNVEANIVRELERGWDGDAYDMRQIDSLLAEFAARCQGIYGLEDLIARAKELGY